RSPALLQLPSSFSRSVFAKQRNAAEARKRAESCRIASNAARRSAELRRRWEPVHRNSCTANLESATSLHGGSTIAQRHSALFGRPYGRTAEPCRSRTAGVTPGSDGTARRA